MQIWHTATAVFVFFIFMLAALSYIGWRQNRQRRQGFACRPNQDVVLPALSTTFSRKKPAWVMLEVLRIKALMGKNVGCRKVADTFNRLHTPMSVGKSFVSDAIKRHQYLLLNISRELRDKRPRPTQINAVWGLDLTFVRESRGTQRTVFGAIDHGSRVCTRLVMVLNKRSWTLIGHLCLAIGEFGKPDAICAEAVILLKDKHFSPNLSPVLRKMKPTRQVECLELMVATDNITVAYAQALLAATPSNMLVGEQKPKKIKGVTADQMALMEREMSNLEGQFKMIENSFGQDVLNLVLARGYLAKLLNNESVIRFLTQSHSDLLTEFANIVNATSLDK